MLIRVIRSDNEYDYVQDILLDGMIKAKEVIKFKGDAGWVTIGTHPISKDEEEKAVQDNDKMAAKDSTFAGEYRRAYSSSLEPF